MVARLGILSTAMFALTACAAARSGAVAVPPTATSTPDTTAAPATQFAWTAAADSGGKARVVLTAPIYDSPGARVPVIVTVHDAPAGLPADALSATASDGSRITDCTDVWRNQSQATVSRTCYLLAPASLTHLELTGHARWNAAGGGAVSLESPTVRFRTSGPVSGPVSLEAAHRIENCGNPGPAVWLTFDDYVPSVAVAHSLVDTLGRNHARGRFFLNHVTPEIRHILESSGHIVQDHTRDHLAMNDLSDAGIHEQITTGPHPTAGAPPLLRPPYGAGAEASRVVDLIAKDGYATCRWTVDSRDWAGYPPEQMAQAVRDGNSFTPPVAAGGVILMHANHFTPEKLQAVVDAVHARGLEVDGPGNG
ncbi:MAG TPA: polysaccharide deacetylase family protein [Sporichthyaceae bacterium]|jgi:peptidoglycan/xylan/chitin deacetylase (PgdA/CDA1 family)|nr:polysaccharide deacetylase family protein [Sporichthyaceae bacterium]